MFGTLCFKMATSNTGRKSTCFRLVILHHLETWGVQKIQLVTNKLKLEELNTSQLLTKSWLTSTELALKTLVLCLDKLTTTGLTSSKSHLISLRRKLASMSVDLSIIFLCIQSLTSQVMKGKWMNWKIRSVVFKYKFTELQRTATRN